MEFETVIIEFYYCHWLTFDIWEVTLIRINKLTWLFTLQQVGPFWTNHSQNTGRKKTKQPVPYLSENDGADSDTVHMKKARPLWRQTHHQSLTRPIIKYLVLHNLNQAIIKYWSFDWWFYEGEMSVAHDKMASTEGKGEKFISIKVRLFMNDTKN